MFLRIIPSLIAGFSVALSAPWLSAAISWPASPPSDATGVPGGGYFQLYFSNIANSICPDGQGIGSYNTTSGIDYLKGNCKYFFWEADGAGAIKYSGNVNIGGNTLVSGNQIINGGLTVNGATTLNNALNVSGPSTLNTANINTLTVGTFTNLATLLGGITINAQTFNGLNPSAYLKSAPPGNINRLPRYSFAGSNYVIDSQISDDGNSVSIAGSNPAYKFFVNGNARVEQNLIVGAGRIGVGVASPTEKLDVNGKIKTTGLQITGGAPGIGKILTSDASGNASWQTPSIGGGGGGAVIWKNFAFLPSGTNFSDRNDSTSPLLISITLRAGCIYFNPKIDGVVAGEYSNDCEWSTIHALLMVPPGSTFEIPALGYRTWISITSLDSSVTCTTAGIPCTVAAAISPPVCGNNVIEAGETCDQGIMNGYCDYCNSSCTGNMPACDTSGG